MSIKNKIINMCNQDYCLWVGAGIGKHISSIGKYETLTWPELVAKLEVTGGLTCPEEFNGDFPARIQVALRQLGRKSFQKTVRSSVFDPIVQSILQWMSENLELSLSKNELIIPNQIRMLAKLATKANPIVNFNVETLSSRILASFGGNYSLKAFHPPVPGASERVGWTAGGGKDGAYSRHVIHPHGAVDLTGMCVVSEAEYKSLNGTLAMQVAVNSAFASNLLIIGMSLNDTYLKDQLSLFRGQIHDIFWVTNSVSDSDKYWSWKNNIEIMTVSSFDEFWFDVVENLKTTDDSNHQFHWAGILNLILHYAENEDPHVGFLKLDSLTAKYPDLSSRNDAVDHLIMSRNTGMGDGVSPLIPIQEIRELRRKLSGVYNFCKYQNK